MKERRKTKRRYLLYYMRVYDTATREQIGNLVDITPKGMMIVNPQPIPEGRTFQIRLELSGEVSEKPHMEFSAVSIWCKPDIEPSLYNTGFEIRDLSSEDARIIKKIVENFSFRDNRPVKADAKPDR